MSLDYMLDVIKEIVDWGKWEWKLRVMWGWSEIFMNPLSLRSLKVIVRNFIKPLTMVFSAF